MQLHKFSVQYQDEGNVEGLLLTGLTLESWIDLRFWRLLIDGIQRQLQDFVFLCNDRFMAISSSSGRRARLV